MTGSAVCVSVDGKYEITWTLTNDYNGEVTLGDITLETNKDATKSLSKTPLPTPTKIAARPDGTPLTKISFTSVVERPATAVKLNYKARWSDNFRATGASGWIQLDGPCPKPSTSQSPSASPSPSPSKSASTSPSPSKSVSPSASPTPNLPVTGSSSTMPLVGTGAALVVGGVALVATLRRRRRVTFTAE
ncbi:LPXTG cell wall anchor domain-containing protein [Dactylosporangium siamense]|uniref:LPXTG cell wall anchor domain-containing protein n=1 Tax=Dactylosporangium siamense TaxID=685454 RepID=UPI0019451878|nr:LPXTG cell wall anchor domain-containing protein [Dactylosporangium siamense]